MTASTYTGPAKRKPRKLPPPTERTVQRQIVAELRARGLRVIAIPNGGQYVGDAEARVRMAMAKRMDGEVSGMPDLLILTRTNDRDCGFLEVKRPGAAKTGAHVERQRDCHESLRADHYPVAVVDTPEAALAAVREWGMVA